jgi:hypothetical protein
MSHNISEYHQMFHKVPQLDHERPYTVSKGLTQAVTALVKGCFQHEIGLT